MKKIIIIVTILLLSNTWLSAQGPGVAFDTSVDTTICLGSNALLEVFLDTTLYNTNTYDVSVLPFAYLPPTGIPISPNLTDDVYYGPFQIGFDFCFFGEVYSQFWVGANGWLSFQALSSATYDPWVTQPIPNTDPSRPRAAVMFPYRDWYPGVGGNGTILWESSGTAPNRRLKVTYLGVPLFSCTTSMGTFQCVLHEVTNIIDINILNCPTCMGWSGGTGVMGIQNAAGTQAFVVPGRNNTAFTANNETWRFSPNGTPQPITYTWTGGGMPTSTGATLLVDPTVATTYTVTYDPCGGNPPGTPDIVSTITVTPEPCGWLSGSSVNVDCFGASTGSATLIINEGIAPFDFTWDNGVTVTNTIDSVNTITNIPAGTYGVTVSSNGGSYTLDTTFVITQNPQMFVDVGSLPETCPGASDGSVTVSLTNGFSPFIFSCSTQPNSPPANSPNYTFSGLPTGNYQITVTDTYGCIAAGTQFVDELALTFTVDQSELMCHGDTDAFASITVSGGTTPYDYQWSNGGNTQGITNLAAGNYVVIVTDDNGCEISTSYTFSEPPPVMLYVSNDKTICLSQTANIVSAVAGGTPPYSHLWTPGGYGSPNIDVTPSTSTEYCVYVTDAHNCKSNTKCISIFVNPPLDIEAHTLRDTICEGDTTTIFAEIDGGNGGPYFYELFQGPLVNPPFDVHPETSTKYIIVGQDGCGSPSVADTVDITVLPAPMLNITSDIITGCQPLAVNFNENSPHSGQNYYWDFGDSEMFNYSTDKNPTYIFTTPGIFEVSITITNSWFCSTKGYLFEDILVHPKPLSIFTANPQNPSIVDPVIEFGNQSIDAQQWYWSFGDGDSVSIEYPLPHSYPSIPATYVVSLITESDMGCRDTTFQEIKVLELENIFYAPTAFNPFSNVEENRYFRPVASLIVPETFYMSIYDRWGQIVFETTNYEQGWNGRSTKGNICKIGTYTWRIKYRDLTGVDYKKVGNITIVQ